MTVQLYIDNVEIPAKFIRFSDGGSNVKLEIPEGFIPKNYYSISVDPTTPADNYLWEIFLVKNALSKSFNRLPTDRILCLPYLPHARADRVFEEGNSLPLEEFLDGVLGFTEILLTDPHSDFYKQYQDIVDFTVKHQHECFLEVVKDIQSGDVLIAPDKGSVNKIYKLQQALDKRMIAVHVIEAGKKRDISTGRIIETTLPESADLTGKRVFIVDDILDAGGTFIPLGNKLKEVGAKEVNLYITHGIFAKGLSLLKGSIDKLHVYQTVSNYVTMTDINNFNNGKEVK